MATTTKIKLREEVRTIELMVPEDAEIPASEDEAVIIVVIKNSVGVHKPVTYDWAV